MNRKLSLELDSLRVDSFTTEEPDASRGTVLANQLCPVSQSTCIQIECTCIPTEMSCDTTGTGGGGGPVSRQATCPARLECGSDFC